ncbi:uncharacterized protein LOC130668023 [Microplitis mediator]|uniref:uncharacterized protein LOC130668023 n=1 Tax=Microplitis mediator TaxID=375433 RepID=UPI0025562B76|nr:uncharacterized protein LOC130668023 [Microplitis mediator]
MTFLQVFILIITFNAQLIEINSKSLNNSSIIEKSQHSNISPPVEPKINLSSKSDRNKSETVKSVGQNRNAKFFYAPSFLTGLGIGSLASSAALASSSSPSNPELLLTASNAVTKRHPRPMTIFMDTNRSLPMPPISSLQDNFNVYDSTYPYIALSTSLFDQSLRSIYNMLGHLRSQLAGKETSNDIQKISMNNLNNYEVNNSAEETSNIKVINKDDREQLGIVNRSVLKDVIKESIEEINNDLEQRQGTRLNVGNSDVPMVSKTPEPTVRQNNDKTNGTTGDINKNGTQMVSTTVPPINTTVHPGYYGGNPQNINNINLIPAIPGLPSHSYGYPNEIQYAPPPNIYEYGYGQGHVHGHGHGPGPGYGQGAFNQDYYHPESFYEIPVDHSSSGSFSATTEHWPIYPPYARALKFPNNDKNSKINTNSFRPSSKFE